jgi:hypothetical protein
MQGQQAALQRFDHSSRHIIAGSPISVGQEKLVCGKRCPQCSWVAIVSLLKLKIESKRPYRSTRRYSFCSIIQMRDEQHDKGAHIKVESNRYEGIGDTIV